MTYLKGNFSLCEQAVCSFRTTRNVGGENESLYQRPSFPGIISAQGTEVIKQRQDIAESFLFLPWGFLYLTGMGVQVWIGFRAIFTTIPAATEERYKDQPRCSARQWNSSARRYGPSTWAGNHGNCFKRSCKERLTINHCLMPPWMALSLRGRGYCATKGKSFIPAVLQAIHQTCTHCGHIEISPCSLFPVWFMSWFHAVFRCKLTR